MAPCRTPRVWLNGHELGGRPYGYIGFAFDLTPYLQVRRQENVLAVRLTPEERSSRWYPGAGIYRNVWLDVTGPVHVAQWGTYITTPAGHRRQGAPSAVRTEIRNRTSQEARVTLQTTILDAAGQAGRDARPTPSPSPPAAPRPSTRKLDRRPPAALGHRHIRTSTRVVSEVLDANKKVVDRYVTPFGIRTIDFDKTKGFLLNGRAIKIHGVCNHHDLGALGAAVNRRATERQLQIMKSAGVNAIRTSHNPPSPELLEFCDRMGLARHGRGVRHVAACPKVANDYHKYFDEWSERDVRDMVRRDRNHPSIIMWSIGNEIPEQGSPEARPSPNGSPTSSTRKTPPAPPPPPSTIPKAPSGTDSPPRWISPASTTPMAVRADPEGASRLDHLRLGDRVLRQFARRLPPADREVREAPLAAAHQLRRDRAALGLLPRRRIRRIRRSCPTCSASSSGPASTTSASPRPTSMAAARDQPTGRRAAPTSASSTSPASPRTASTSTRASGPTKPMVHVLPHWNWQDREGQAIPVMAYTNADEVELFLNGKSLGRKKRFSEPVEIPVGHNAEPMENSSASTA